MKLMRYFENVKGKDTISIKVIRVLKNGKQPHGYSRSRCLKEVREATKRKGLQLQFINCEGIKKWRGMVNSQTPSQQFIVKALTCQEANLG